MAYSKKEILSAVTWYRDNGMNAAKTAQKFSVSRNTIRDWVNANKEIIDKPNNQQLTRIETARANNIISIEEKITKRAIQALNIAFERANLLMETEDDLNKITKFIEVVTKINTEKETKEAQNDLNQYQMFIRKKTEDWIAQRNVIDIKLQTCE